MTAVATTNVVGHPSLQASNDDSAGGEEVLTTPARAACPATTTPGSPASPSEFGSPLTPPLAPSAASARGNRRVGFACANSKRKISTSSAESQQPKRPRQGEKGETTGRITPEKESTEGDSTATSDAVGKEWGFWAWMSWFGSRFS